MARRDDLLVLVEVKLRRSGPVPAAEALRFRQLRRQRRAAGALLARTAWAAAVRVDLVSVERRPDGVRLEHRAGVAPI